jgi:NodT family efflux transporter outer membrane factor (OMF) lipoprotein
MKNPTRNAVLCCAVAATLGLTGCAAVVRTPYERPAVATPEKWAIAVDTNADETMNAWWTRFGDAELNRVIDDVLARNNNLAAATLRVRRAQLQADLAGRQLLPSINAGANSGVSKNIREGGSSNRTNSASISASYELDLWGRVSSQRDAASWEARATELDREATRLALIGTTAGLYWQIGYLNQRIAASQTSIEYAQQTLELVRVQYRAGAVSALEVNDAEQNLVSQQAAQLQLQQQLVETRNAFAILFDAPPSNEELGPSRLPDSELPAIAAGIPADLLRRRPDLRAAELRLRSTLAGVDGTRASYYPSISLTSSVGSSSASLVDVLKNPVASLGAGLSLPFLQFRQMRLSIAVSEAQYEEAVLNFRQALYQAFADTANALSARETLEQRYVLLVQSLEAARKAERMNEVRYRAGAVGLRSWLDAQERRRSAEISLAEAQLSRLNNQVLVYQVLGGDAVPSAMAE